MRDDEHHFASGHPSKPVLRGLCRIGIGNAPGLTCNVPIAAKDRDAMGIGRMQRPEGEALGLHHGIETSGISGAKI